MLERINELWSYAQKVAQAEMTDTAVIDYVKISPEVIADTAKKEYPRRLAKYEEKERILNGRNSFSKTDNDATFMRMKDDKMNNKELKSAYNI